MVFHARVKSPFLQNPPKNEALEQGPRVKLRRLYAWVVDRVETSAQGMKGARALKILTDLVLARARNPIQRERRRRSASFV